MSRSVAPSRAKPSHDPDPTVGGYWAHRSLDAARRDLQSGDYRAARGRIEQTLRELEARDEPGLAPSEVTELGRAGDELLARVLRACNAERSVLLARGESPPECSS